MAYYAVIMAGGTGTRLWPLSRRACPKQSLKLVGERTMFQYAVDRVLPQFGAQCVLVVAPEAYVSTLSAQAPELPNENFIVEPEGRGTAPCIGLAAVHLRRRDPAATMAVLTADHHVRDAECFRRVLKAAARVAADGYLVTLGIKPSGPVTGYGYIQQGERLGTVEGFDVFQAARFTEKPDLQTAQRMVESGAYSWNSGMFIWQVERILEEFKRQMPDLYGQLIEIEASVGTAAYQTTIARVWPGVTRQTIDYGIMEGARKVAVIPVDIGWSDIGSWASLAELWPADAAGNIVAGHHVGRDTRDTVIFGGERLIATIGLQNVVIVDAGDAILICARGREQEVRELVQQLERERKEAYL